MLRPARLLPLTGLLTSRSARQISPTDRDLLLGVPGPTETGLPPAGLIQLSERTIRSRLPPPGKLRDSAPGHRCPQADENSEGIQVTATPPGKPHSPAPSGKGSGPGKRSGDEQTRVFYSRFLGWLVLAIIVAYAGLQMPLPWRLMTLVAALIGVVGGVVLLVHCIRRKLSSLILIGAVMVTLSCSFFLVTAGVQTIFWEASATFDECMRSALTERSLNHCYSQYEQDIFSSIPGVP